MERAAIITTICDKTCATLIHTIGRIAALYRRSDKQEQKNARQD